MIWRMSLRAVRCVSAAAVGGLSLGMATSGYAQPVPPPVFPAVDERGVDVATGAFVHTQTDVVIGQPGAGGLAFSRYYQSAPATYWTHNHNSYVHGIGTTCSVVIGTRTETFTSTSNDCQGTFTPQQQMGSTLVAGTYTYTYTARDGTVVIFTRFTGYQSILNMNAAGMRGYIAAVTSPANEVTTYLYEWESFCFPDPFNCWVIYDIGRIQTVYNNVGYRLWFNYPGSPTGNYQTSRVTGINNAFEYCAPTSCSQAWPFATYAYNSFGQVTSATNALGQAITYIYSGSPSRVVEVQFPDHPDHDVNVAYTSAKVSSIVLGSDTWLYSYSDLSGQRTTTVTNPGSSTRTYKSTISNGRINEVTNESGQKISYLYDGAARQTRVTLPEGNNAQYTYDSRGNITQLKRVAKSGSGDIITTAAFPSSCTNPRTCNQPADVDDRRARVPHRLHVRRHARWSSDYDCTGAVRLRTRRLRYPAADTVYLCAGSVALLDQQHDLDERLRLETDRPIGVCLRNIAVLPRHRRRNAHYERVSGFYDSE